MLLYSYSPLCRAVRFDTQAARLLILITRITGSELVGMSIIGKIFYAVLNLLSCSTCPDSDTLKKSTDSHLTARKISLPAEGSRNFPIYLQVYWLFPCNLNKIKQSSSCLNCTTKSINAIFTLSHRTRFAGIIRTLISIQYHTEPVALLFLCSPWFRELIHSLVIWHHCKIRFYAFMIHSLSWSLTRGMC